MQHPDDATLEQWRDDALPPDELARVEAHVSDCDRCVERVGSLRDLSRAFGVWADAIPPLPDDFTDQVMRAVETSSPAPKLAPPAPAPTTPTAVVRPFPLRRVVYPALAAAAAMLFWATTRAPVTPSAPQPVAHTTAPTGRTVVTALVEPPKVTVGPAEGDTGGVEVTRVDVRGAQSYAVMMVPGVDEAETAIVWIADPPDPSPPPTATP